MQNNSSTIALNHMYFMEMDPLTEALFDVKASKQLQAKKFACFYEDTQSKKAVNEKKIKQLRKTNAELREVYRESCRGDERVIAGVFRKRGKRELLAMQRQTINPAIDNLDLTLCHQNRELDLLKHKQKRSVSELERLSDEVRDLEKLESVAKEKELHQIINVKNNEIEKAKVKAETAAKIYLCYRQIRDLLDIDVSKFPSKIDALQKELQIQKLELNEVAQDYEHAKEKEKTMHTKLVDLEKNTHFERRNRDLRLQKTKKQVEEQIQSDLVQQHRKRGPTVKTAAVTALGINLKKVMSAETAEDIAASQRSRQLQILRLVDQFSRMKDSFMVSDVETIVCQLTRQRVTHEHLTWQTTERKRRLKYLRQQLEQVSVDMTNQKYSIGTQDALAQAGLDAQTEKLEQHEKDLNTMSDMYHKAETLLNDATKAITIMNTKANAYQITGKKNQRLPRGQPLADLTSFQERMENLLAQMADITDPSVLYKCCGSSRLQNFMTFVEHRLSVSPERFATETTETVADFFEEDIPERVDYLSYDDIKKRSNRIVDTRGKVRK